jgi:starch-binding outer membrane protein, SusD/RagB family
MKRIKLNIATLLLVAITAGSCKKAVDFAPYNSVASTEAFSTAAKCLVSLFGVYDAAQSGAYVDGTIRGYPFGAASIEQGDCRGEDVVNLATFFQISYQATYNASNANSEGHWNSLYALINKANVSIDGFRGAGTAGVLSSAVAAQYEAECRFLRALSHHELMIHFARPYRDGGGTQLGVPYRDFAVNVPATVEQLRKLPRATADSVYRGILRDLDYAEANLPATFTGPTAANDRTVRASSAAAIALKQRIKLHMGDWAGAIAEGNKLIPATINPLVWTSVVSPIGAWALTSSPDGPFAANGTNTESIFSVRNNSIDNTGVNGSLPSMFGAGSLGGRGLVSISPIIWNNSGWKCDDKRRTLLYVLGSNANSATSIFTNKYRDYVNRGDYAPQIRYAEVLLNQAEAVERNAGTISQRAIDLLNTVRNRGLQNPATEQYVAANFATSADLIRAILLERRIEFLAEGKRWSDITRLAVDASYTTNGIPAKAINGTAVAGLTPTPAQITALYNCGSGYTPGQAGIPYSDYRFLFPIPSNEIIQNPVITQNPGY